MNSSKEVLNINENIKHDGNQASIRLKRSLMDKEIIHLYCDVVAKEETINTEVVGG